MAKIIKINTAQMLEYDGGVAELPIIEHKIGRVLLGVFHLFHANTKKNLFGYQRV
jgi:hypothetical protein